MSTYLDPDTLHFHRDEHNTLRLEGPHMSTHVAGVRRALPLSEPEKFLVLTDPLGDEIGVLRDLNELETASRELVREVLARAYSMTRITRILEVEREPLTGQVLWRVEIESDEDSEEIVKEPEVLTALDQLEPHVVRLQNKRTIPASTNVVKGTVLDNTSFKTVNTNGIKQANSNGDIPGTNPLISNRAANTNAVNNNSASTVSGNGDDEVEESEDEVGSDVKLLRRLRRRLRSDKNDDDAIATQEREFAISGQEDVQTARYPHIYIVDTERNRYEILDCEALDLESRRAAESYF